MYGSCTAGSIRADARPPAVQPRAPVPTIESNFTEVFAPLTRELSVTRVDPDPPLRAPGDSGMVLLTAVAAGVRA